VKRCTGLKVQEDDATRLSKAEKDHSKIMSKIIRTNSNSADFKKLVLELDKDLRSRYNELQNVYDQYNAVPDLPTVVLAYENEVAIGCGCFKHFDDSSVEIKRMFVTEIKRGTGVASFIISELENWARELGYEHAVLETGNKQFEAINFYKREGYFVTDNYGQYIGMQSSICMKKKL
jgi:putative acetyltransferase